MSSRCGQYAEILTGCAIFALACGRDCATLSLMQSDYSIHIEAGEAFGSGGHPSSALALWLLAALPEFPTPERVLDIGCGSGMLAIAAAKRWNATQVIAADILPRAVEQTRANAHANGVGDRLRALRADGCAHPEILAAAPYPLILCNILSDLHIRLAQDFARLLAPQGNLILSGILVWRLPEVLAYYDRLNLTVVAEEKDGDWRALTLTPKGMP